MRTRFQNLRSNTALVRPGPGSGLPGQFYVNMVDRAIGFFNANGDPVDIAYLPLAGGSLSGFLNLHADPTAPAHAVTKAYSDAEDDALETALVAFTNAQVATRLPLAGGTLSGFLSLHANPALPAHAANRAYVDAQVNTRLTQAQAEALFLRLTGGTLTGFLSLHADPTAPAHAANRAYVDAQVATRLTQAQADALYLRLSGGVLTGPLTLSGPPTAPNHATTRAWVEALVGDAGAATHVGDTPPLNPDQGQLWFKTIEPVGLYVWYVDADSSQWVSVGGSGSGGGGSPTSVEIVRANVTAGWQVWGDTLIQWGTGQAPGTVAADVAFPKAFRAAPSVTVVPFSASLLRRTSHLTARTTTGFSVACLNDSNALVAMSFNWIAIGEALDADKLPKEVQIPGGGGGGGSGGLPVGTIAFFAANSIPPGWLICNNQRVTTVYPELRQYLLDAGSPFGTTGGDPRVPELRGEFIRGFSAGRAGVDDGRVFGSSQLDQLQRLTGQLSDVQTVGTPLRTVGILRQLASTASAIWQGATSVTRNTTFQLDTQFDPTVRSGDETRPRNVALLPCIRAFAATVVEGQANFGIATAPEARAGVRNDVLMTPALVQARRGEQTLNILALPFIDSDPIPPEASEIILTLNINRGAASVLDLIAPDDAGANYNSTIQYQGAAFSPPEVNPTTGFILDNAAAGGTVQGTIRMALNRATNIWWSQSDLRRGTLRVSTVGGLILSAGVPLSRLRLRNSVTGTAGGASLLWRI